MEDNNFEYFEGVKTIMHDDGSTTYINYTHEPYVEPLTRKETAAVLGIMTAVTVGVCALPFMVERIYDWTEHRAEVRRLKREKKIADMKSANS